MIDVSDGLGIDLDRLAKASGVGVALETLPVAEGATRGDALGGGEDYELVFAAPEPEAVAASFSAAGLRACPHRALRFGSVIRRLGDETLAASGWEHRLRSSSTPIAEIPVSGQFERPSQLESGELRGESSDGGARRHGRGGSRPFGPDTRGADVEMRRRSVHEAWTRWMFGSQRRLVRRWEWDRFIPKPGCFPHISHTAATMTGFSREFLQMDRVTLASIAMAPCETIARTGTNVAHGAATRPLKQ